MDETEGWERSYGPQDGPWLREQFRLYTQDMGEVKNVRVARADDAAEMARFRKLAEEGEEVAAKSDAVAGDWEVVSPHTGRHYAMGCDWRGVEEEHE